MLVMSQDNRHCPNNTTGNWYSLSGEQLALCCKSFRISQMCYNLNDMFRNLPKAIIMDVSIYGTILNYRKKIETFKIDII